MAQRGSGKRHPLKSVLAGGFAGGIEICIMFPTEYVKTQLQLDSSRGISSGKGRRFTGSLNCASLTLKEHGIGGLYRGMSSLLYGSIPKSAVRFTVFDVLKNQYSDADGKLSRQQTLLCGLGAGTSEAIAIVTPMEAVKVKLIHDQIQAKPRFRPGFKGIVDVVRQEGIVGVYKGLGPTILKQGSNQAIRFLTYNELKSFFQGGNPDVQLGAISTALCGALAGAASVFGNTPIDVVKSRMQGLDAAKYRNAFHCVRMILKEDGIRGFYKGTIPRLGRVCGDVAIVFSLYEMVNNALDTVWDTSDYGK